MKLMTHKTLLISLVVFSLAAISGPLTAQVYKTVDEDGNVVFTDKEPAEGAKPMDLPPLSVIEAPAYDRAAKKAVAPGDEEIPLKTLRRNYSDFTIVSPQQEESIWHPEGPISVAWTSSNQLQGGMMVTIMVDGKEHVVTNQTVIPVAGLERGEHTISAHINDARNRRIATADTVTFFIRQPGVYNRVRPTPRVRG